MRTFYLHPVLFEYENSVMTVTVFDKKVTYDLSKMAGYNLDDHEAEIMLKFIEQYGQSKAIH